MKAVLRVHKQNQDLTLASKNRFCGIIVFVEFSIVN